MGLQKVGPNNATWWYNFFNCQILFLSPPAHTEYVIIFTVGYSFNIHDFLLVEFNIKNLPCFERIFTLHVITYNSPPKKGTCICHVLWMMAFTLSLPEKQVINFQHCP